MAKHKKKAPAKRHRGVEVEVEIAIPRHKKKETPKARKKIAKVMREFKHDELHSGSEEGPLVKNKKQALAIAMSEARKRA